MFKQVLSAGVSSLLALVPVHKANPNHDDKGRFTTGDGIKHASVESVLASIKDHDVSTFEKASAFVEKASKALGVPADLQLKTDAGKFEFDLNGETIEAGAHYTPKIGSRKARLTVYPEGHDAEGMVQLIAHEAMHHRFTKGGVGDSMLEDLSAEEVTHLAKTGNVTPYAKEWWGAVKSGEADHGQAIDETLAEIAQLSSKDRKKLDKQWVTLFNKLMSFSEA